MKLTSTPLRRWLIVGVFLIVALPAGYFMARHYALPAYKSWREAKLARMTQEFMAEGDYDNALLTARQALRKNQRSLAHWKLATEAARAKGTSDVIYYQKNVANLEKTLASQLELLRLSLQHGSYRDALDTIEHINPKAKDDPDFHRLAAQTYLAVGRPIAARVHLDSLISLQPNDQKAQLDRAQLELADDSEGKNQQLRSDILALSQVPEFRIRALEMLLKDSINREDANRAADIARQLRDESALNSAQKIVVLAGLALGDEEEATQFRRRLQAEFTDDPESVVALANYFKRSGPAAEGRKWFDSLTPEVRKNPRVQEAIASAFLEWQDWTRLDQAISNTQWDDREFMRQAFAAYLARKNARMADAGNAWRLAVIQAGDNARATSELLALVARWGWQNEQYDLVWKLFALMPRNESISRQLIAWEHQRGHTANLNRIYARLSEFAGEDRMLRNNFAYSSLLLDANLSRAMEVARNNYQADPENPYFVTTQALALYKQNKPAAALALLETIRPAAISTPERMMLRALFRASSGDAAGAADLIDGVKATSFLPEERRLLARAASEVARLDSERGQTLRLDALNTSGEIDRSKGWLKHVSGVTSEDATVEMHTTDSLYAMGDLRGLGAQLRKGGWGRHEHLRLALIAYVARGRSDEGSARSYWRTAMGTVPGKKAELRQLGELASAWSWRDEQIAVISKVFEIDPSNREAFAILMTHYRNAGRTAELVSVLSASVSINPDDQDQLSALAYYSMLSGLNVSRAYVMAHDSHRAEPNEPRRQLVYAFALWKQRRYQEAWDLLEKVKADDHELVPVPLLRAAVLADLERGEEAAEELKEFDGKNALPEEASLATLVASRAKSEERVTQAL